MTEIEVTPAYQQYLDSFRLVSALPPKKPEPEEDTPDEDTEDSDEDTDDTSEEKETVSFTASPAP